MPRFRTRRRSAFIACAIGFLGGSCQPQPTATPQPIGAPARPAARLPTQATPADAHPANLADAAGGADAGPPTATLTVDLSDEWAPTIFSEGDVADAKGGAEVKENPYRKTFLDLANERMHPDGRPLRPGERNRLEPYGIPPTLTVLQGRIEASNAQGECFAAVDAESLRLFDGNVGYQTREAAKQALTEAESDEAWVGKQTATPGVTLDTLLADPKTRARADRHRRGQARVRAIRALQARLLCEGLLSDKSRYAEGAMDLPTHEALAEWERQNDIFGWGFLGDETLLALQRTPTDLHFETFKRIIAERVADAAGIVEDGSVGHLKKPATYKDEAGEVHPVPDLIGTHVTAVLAALRVASPSEMLTFMRERREKGGFASFTVAVPAPPLPPYYTDDMKLEVEIDRGDIWYDFPYDESGKPRLQPREQYPHLTLFVLWNKQRIPLVQWRTTIGSWRSELHGDGRVYLKYKNSDVGPRVWRHIVAGPVWVPPEGTPSKDLLTRKVLDIQKGPETLVNTDVMGPGFQSAYGLVMAIHVKPSGKSFFDNQIRTHGSVDYTSIARRFSHGCHRLVNNRAVRLMDFVLRHRPHKRLGNSKLRLKKQFAVDGTEYKYEIKTRGYYYELDPPLPVMVTEGRIRGVVKKPIAAFMPKPGVDYTAAPAADDPVAAPTLGP